MPTPTDSSTLVKLAEGAQERDRAAERLQQLVLAAADEGHAQRQIAEVLGVSQPAVSQMISSARARARLSKGPVGRKLAEHRAEVLDIARAHGASKVRVFGSVARGEDTEESNVDLLVSMPGRVGIFKIGELEIALSDALGVDVDVMPEEIVKRDALPALMASSVPL